MTSEKCMNTEELYKALDNLPPHSGRMFVFAERCSPSCTPVLVNKGGESYFCVSCDSGGDMFKTVDAFKYFLSFGQRAKVLWGDEAYWEDPRSIVWYGITGCEVISSPEAKDRLYVLLRQTVNPVSGPSVDEFYAGWHLTND